ALESIAIAKGAEQLVVAIDRDQVVAADIARGERQESRWIDLAGVTDEQETVAVVHALRAPHAVGEAEADPRGERRGRCAPGTRAPLGYLLLHDDAPVLRCGRALDVERRALRQLVHAMEDRLELLC